MSGLPYHKRYHSDALSGFMSLDLEERGAYQTLLDMMYDRGGPLIDNERLLAGYMNCSIRKWRSIRESLIAKGKIQVNQDGRITNARVDKELENSAKTSRKHAENGLNGARKLHENRKKSNENSESGVAGPEPGHDHTRSQKLEDIYSSLSPSNPRASMPTARRDPELLKHCQWIAQTINLVRPLASADFDTVQGWIDAGMTFDWHIEPGVQRVAAREQGRGNPIRSIRYLDQGVREYHAEWLAERERLRGAA